jgi:hypothetical protein
MNTKEVFTKKRLAAVAEAYQLLQSKIDEVREAFIEAAKDDKDVSYWPLFDLQLLNAVQKVSKQSDVSLGHTTKQDLRSMCFLAYGEIEHLDHAKYLADTDEALRLALSGQNPSRVAEERRTKDVAEFKASQAKQKAEDEAARSMKLTPTEEDASQRDRLFESRRDTVYNDIGKTMGFPRGGL